METDIHGNFDMILFNFTISNLDLKQTHQQHHEKKHDSLYPRTYRTTTATTEAPATSHPPATYPGSGGHLECHSVYPFKSEAVDVWCDDNCNHVPSFCPESHCACQ